MLPYFYNNQLKRYIVQFMYLFSGMQVRVGKTGTKDEHLIPVPVHFSKMDKVAAAIVAGGTSNKPIQVPVMSVDMISLRQDPNMSAGLNQIHSQTFLPEGGYFAEDVKTLTRLRPAGYVLDLDLAIWTSNTDQHFQILEQILPVFNPSVQIQTSDKQFDWTKITEVSLVGMNFNGNYPLGTANRIEVTNLQFSIPIYLSAPANIKDEFVRDVMLRIQTINDGNLADQLAELLDDDTVPYENVASADDIIANTPPEE